MFYFYLVLSAVLLPVLNNFFGILRQPYSWWLVPVLFITSFLGLCFCTLLLCAFGWRLQMLINRRSTRRRSESLQI